MSARPAMFGGRQVLNVGPSSQHAHVLACSPAVATYAPAIAPTRQHRIDHAPVTIPLAKPSGPEPSSQPVAAAGVVVNGQPFASPSPVAPTPAPQQASSPLEQTPSSRPQVLVPRLADVNVPKASFVRTCHQLHVTEDPRGDYAHLNPPRRQPRNASSSQSVSASVLGQSAADDAFEPESNQERVSSSMGASSSGSSSDRTPGDWRFARVSAWPKELDTERVASIAGFSTKVLSSEGKVVLIGTQLRSQWNSLRALRLSRTMLIQEEAHMPVFQPVKLQEPWWGLPPGTMLLYAQKMLAGKMLPGSTIQVGRLSQPEPIANALLAKLFTEGHNSVSLKSFGPAATMVALYAVAEARAALAHYSRRTQHQQQRQKQEQRHLSSDARGQPSKPSSLSSSCSGGVDLAVVLESGVEEFQGHEGATLINRLVVSKCEPLRPTSLLAQPVVRVKPPAPTRRR